MMEKGRALQLCGCRLEQVGKSRDENGRNRLELAAQSRLRLAGRG